MANLSAGEAFVLAELARGEHPKEVADKRGVTVTAISKMCRHAREKLGARTTCQAVLFFALEQAKQPFKP